MIRREDRDKLADVLNALLAGYASNAETDDFLFDQDYFTFSTWYEFSDNLLPIASKFTYGLYSEAPPEYRLTGTNKPDKTQRQTILRWILFLRSDLEYEWPRYSFSDPLRLSAGGCLLMVFSLGFWPRGSQLVDAFEQWKKSGEFDVWPFLTRSDYERTRDRACPFTALRAAS